MLNRLESKEIINVHSLSEVKDRLGITRWLCQTNAKCIFKIHPGEIILQE